MKWSMSSNGSFLRGSLTTCKIPSSNIPMIIRTLTNELDSSGNRKQVDFCMYFISTLWDIPAVAVGGRTAKPADHLADCYPTSTLHSGSGRISCLGCRAPAL